MKNYMFTYEWNGSRWGFDVPAESEQEARQRKAAMHLAEYTGEMVCEVPATPSGMAQRLVCWQFFVGLGLGGLLGLLWLLAYAQYPTG